MSDREKTDFRRGDRLLLFAVFLGPVAALSDLGLAYSLVPTACERGSTAMLHLCTAAFFCVALIGAVIGAVIGRHEQRRRDEPDGLLASERTHWLAILAICLSIASAVVIVAFEIPNVILRSCN